MDRERLLDLLAGESRALVDLVRRADPTTPVPGCPEWTLADLAWHVGEVHEFWRTVVALELDDPSEVQTPSRLPDAELADWLATGATELHDVLARTDPGTRVWSWSRQRNVAFVVRRMAHETALHRLDASLATGSVVELDDGIALDAIDEFLTHFIHDVLESAAAVGAPVRLAPVDSDRTWLVREADDGGVDVVRGGGSASVVLRGPALDLLLVLWRRRPLSAIDVAGDRDAAARFLARSNLD